MQKTESLALKTKDFGHWELRHERHMGKTDHVIKMGNMTCYFNRGIGHTEEEALANARLIVFSPELLFALEEVLDYAENEARSLDSLKDSEEAEMEAELALSACENARAVIAKVRK